MTSLCVIEKIHFAFQTRYVNDAQKPLMQFAELHNMNHNTCVVRKTFLI